MATRFPLVKLLLVLGCAPVALVAQTRPSVSSTPTPAPRFRAAQQLVPMSEDVARTDGEGSIRVRGSLSVALYPSLDASGGLHVAVTSTSSRLVATDKETNEHVAVFSGVTGTAHLGPADAPSEGTVMVSLRLGGTKEGEGTLMHIYLKVAADPSGSLTVSL